MSKSSGMLSFPEYQAVLIPGHRDLIHLASLIISIGSASPPIKQKQVIAAEYFPIRAESMSSVMSSPSLPHSHGLWQPGHLLGQHEILTARLISSGISWQTIS